MKKNKSKRGGRYKEIKKCSTEIRTMIRSLFSMLIVVELVSAAAAGELSWANLKEEAWTLYKSGKYAQAIRVTKKAAEVAQQEFGKDDLRLAESLGNLGALFRRERKEQLAKLYLDQAKAIREKHRQDGLPPGIQTEEFFDRVAKLKGKAATQDKKDVPEQRGVEAGPEHVAPK
jgi:tetratricopeptide (TPR) repeat protein